MLLDKIAALDNRIDEFLKPSFDALCAARHEQNRSLTRWVMKHGSRIRYHLKETGPSDPCWSRRAWLRKMFVENPRPTDTPRIKQPACWPGQWLWALQYDTYNPTGRCDRRNELLETIENTITEQEAVTIADSCLDTAGWLLTDLVNDGDVDG